MIFRVSFKLLQEWFEVSCFEPKLGKLSRGMLFKIQSDVYVDNKVYSII